MVSDENLLVELQETNMNDVFDLVNHDVKRLLQFLYFMWENNKAELQIKQIPIFV